MMNTPEVNVDGSKPFITYRAYRNQYLCLPEGGSIRRRRLLYSAASISILVLLIIAMVWNINQQDPFISWAAPTLFLGVLAGMTVFHANHPHWLNREEHSQLVETYDELLKTWVQIRTGFVLYPSEVASLRTGWQTEYRDGLALKPVHGNGSVFEVKIVGETVEGPLFPVNKIRNLRHRR